jgi:hypothetical protein
MRVYVVLVALLVSALICPAVLYSQETTSGTIAGKVLDPAGKPIAGSIIIAESESGPRTATTDEQGNYVLPFLRPGTFNVRAEAPSGFTTGLKEGVIVGLGQRVTLDFTLQPGKVEEVTVTSSPLVDSTSTASGTNIRYDEFANSVPIGRSFTDTYAVASGVVSGRGSGQGNYSIGGASGLENSYIIDGVNVTNTGYGGIGAYNIVYGSLGTGVTSEFLEEVQIKTGGFEAEFGQALGGIINTIVKSGTNDFHGSVAWYATPEGARSDYTVTELQSGAASTVEQGINDFALSVGGPIVRDKVRRTPGAVAREPDVRPGPGGGGRLRHDPSERLRRAGGARLSIGEQRADTAAPGQQLRREDHLPADRQPAARGDLLRRPGGRRHGGAAGHGAAVRRLPERRGGEQHPLRLEQPGAEVERRRHAPVLHGGAAGAP